MEKKYLFLVLILLYSFTTYQVQSQDKQDKEFDITPTRQSYAEKIYIQLNNTIFSTDETIWFKAIVTNTNHEPTQLSGILYVEFIDFDKRVLDKKLLKLENGIADSFFQLNETLPSGRYLIRAYTAWNKNFNNNFISKQYIDLYTPKKILETDQAIQNIVLTETAS